VLQYLFARFDERFDGAPTLLILDEAWLFLDDPAFASRIRQWLKTLRKKNVSVIFSTQSLADIRDSSIAPAIIESCASRIFLPNPHAAEPQIRAIYESFGLSARQVEIIAQAQPKRDYYYQSRLGNRVFDLSLGPVALAFAGASTPEDQRAIDAVQSGAPDDFASAWLRHCGLDWAADLIPSFQSKESSP
jgi:type IV secretion system protein VirB4